MVRGHPRKIKHKKVKPPKTGFNKFIADAWDVFVERVRIHRAMSILSQQQWSVEFLVYIVKQAAKMSASDIQIYVEHKDGSKLTITNNSRVANESTTDDLLDALTDRAKFDAKMYGLGHII